MVQEIRTKVEYGKAVKVDMSNLQEITNEFDVSLEQVSVGNQVYPMLRERSGYRVLMQGDWVVWIVGDVFPSVFKESEYCDQFEERKNNSLDQTFNFLKKHRILDPVEDVVCLAKRCDQPELCIQLEGGCRHKHDKIHLKYNANYDEGMKVSAAEEPRTATFKYYNETDSHTRIVAIFELDNGFKIVPVMQDRVLFEGVKEVTVEYYQNSFAGSDAETII